MANMSYCRFQNTLEDLRDCSNNMDVSDLSYDEFKARYRLIKLCGEMADRFLDESEEPMPTKEQFERGHW